MDGGNILRRMDPTTIKDIGKKIWLREKVNNIRNKIIAFILDSGKMM